MESVRPADTFVLRIRREWDATTGRHIERWQVEHVQTGLKVYVKGLDEAVAVVRSSLAHRPRPTSPS